jgi:hypothetical protein
MTIVRDPSPAGHRMRRLLGLLLLAVGASLLIGLPLLATAGFDTPINLSKRAEVGLKSAYPDLEASSDGRYVAVVWSRGYDSRPSTKEFGAILLKSANAAIGWEKQVVVNAATASVWGVQPRLVFLPGDSSRVAVVWVECRNQTDQCSRIMLATCDLSSFPDTCQPPQVLYEDDLARLSTPAAAYDGQGRLHVIWKRASGGAEGLWYMGYGSGQPPARIDPSSTTLNSYNPRLAWSSAGSSSAGRLHLAWYEYNDILSSRRIRYLADDSPDDDAWTSTDLAEWRSLSPGYQFSGGVDELANKPSLAASGKTVYLAWDLAKTGSSDFAVAYDGATYAAGVWTWRDADTGNSSGLDCGLAGDGCGVPNGVVFDDNPGYDSPANVAERARLQPSVAISDSMPALAWHYRDSSGENQIYVIAYQASITASGHISWPIPALALLQGNDWDADGLPEDSTNPELAFWPDHQVHIAHMGAWGYTAGDLEEDDWDIFYRGGVMTDTSSVPTPVPPDDPTPTPTLTPTPVPPGQPAPVPTAYPYDDLWHRYVPLVVKD